MTWSGEVQYDGAYATRYDDEYTDVKHFVLVCSWFFRPSKVLLSMRVAIQAQTIEVEFEAEDLIYPGEFISDVFPMDFLSSCPSFAAVDPLELVLKLADVQSVVEQRRREFERVLRSLDRTRSDHHLMQDLHRFAREQKA